MKHLFAAVLLSLLLTGCHGYYQRHIQGNEDSPYFQVPVDSVLQLQREISIPPRSDRIFFQRGQLLPTREVNRYLPYCFLQVVTGKDTAQTVAPGRFVIQRVYDQYRFQLAQDQVEVAQLDRGGGTDYKVLAKIMELHSPREPAVRRLVCAEWGLPQSRSFVTIRMIRAEVRDFFDLQLAPSGPESGDAGTSRPSEKP